MCNERFSCIVRYTRGNRSYRCQRILYVKVSHGGADDEKCVVLRNFTYKSISSASSENLKGIAVHLDLGSILIPNVWLHDIIVSLWSVATTVSRFAMPWCGFQRHPLIGSSYEPYPYWASPVLTVTQTIQGQKSTHDDDGRGNYLLCNRLVILLAIFFSNFFIKDISSTCLRRINHIPLSIFEGV